MENGAKESSGGGGGDRPRGGGSEPSGNGSVTIGSGMVELKKILGPMRRHFQRLHDEVDDLLKKDEFGSPAFMPKYREFLASSDELMAFQGQLRMAIGQAGLAREEEDKEYTEMSQYFIMVESVKFKVEEVVRAGQESDSVASGASSSCQENSAMGVKLPDMEIKKFDGDLKDWLRFRAQFQRIHDNPQLSGSTKFWYLLQYLKEGTEPHEMFSQTPQTEKHYADAMSTLEKRYGNNDLLVQVYINELLKLTSPGQGEKEKIPFEKLFLKVDSHYRSLKSLQLEKVDPNIWLFPLVEKCLPREILYKWKSSRMATEGPPEQSQLDALFQFMEKEREIRRQMEVTLGDSGKKEETRSVDKTSFGTRKDFRFGKMQPPKQTIAFHAKSKTQPCVFCDESGHRSQHCLTAQRKLTYAERMKRLRKGGLCFICILPHRANVCQNKETIKCRICDGRHHVILCKEEDSSSGSEPKRRKTEEGPEASTTQTLNSQVRQVDVTLQTLKLLLRNGNKWLVVRALLDSASMRSYITKDVAKFLGLTPVTEERLIHSVFEGGSTLPKTHGVYEVSLQSVDDNKQMAIFVRDNSSLCANIDRADNLQPEFLKELNRQGIDLNDIGTGSKKVDMLIGADWYGRLLTGKIRHFENGMTAVETVFGWTIIGEYRTPTEGVMMVTCMLSHDRLITNLWELDVIGIRDPVEVLSLTEQERKIKEDFFTKITRSTDGRYIVRLPWKDLHPTLPTNKDVAVQRLISTTKKLKASNLYETYNDLFLSWEQEGFIERTSGTGNNLHYCPHRAVIKTESLTTPVRPVFDASCKGKGGVSLNECLHKGPSYVAMIPDIILIFREKFVGFVSDIRKAFQMIEVDVQDRDALRFLWWKDNELIEYRHKRVLFGANCSPFILGAVIEKHLTSLEGHDKVIAQRLSETLYVDNCCGSESTVEAYHHFRERSTEILSDAQMDLRMWMSSVEDTCDPQSKVISVLGLKWDRSQDEIFVDTTGIVVPALTTKRTVLSTVSKIYDPVGLTSPATLQMKLLLQRLWASKLKWDEELSNVDKQEFAEWSSELHDLSKIRLPRNLDGGVRDHNLWEVHVMCDGSKSSFGAVCYLRVKVGSNYRVSLLGAKAKVAPLKNLTIPRLELMGCLIAARLASTIKKTLKLEDITTYFWSDSTTALAWIRRIREWGTFVGRRVTEINQLTNKSDWFHLPGELNPADLPSRGCRPKSLYESKWVEGPWWLKLPSGEWPHAGHEVVNEEEILMEEKKTPVLQHTVTVVALRHKEELSSFTTVVRIQAWVRRFCFNLRNRTERRTGPLKLMEIERAEVDVIRQIQTESFGDDMEETKGIESFIDEWGVLRLKTKLTYGSDEWNFKFPAILPGKHELVRKLIFDMHVAYCHAGVGFLLVKLRRKYWILKGRHSVRSVTSRCYKCRRFTAKTSVTPIAPLPVERITDAACFESTGMDLAGPFFTKNGKKLWVIVYTCAVYRAVVLRLIPSLSTSAFIKSLQEFIETFRRPTTVFTDNGTNFRGADNLFRCIDWKQVMAEEGISQIRWKFNPASAPWWGGWWERLIRSMKDLLRRTIGKQLLTATELGSVLKKVEEVMNDRPLTYLSEDPEDLEPLTPSLFMNPLGLAKFPEKELIDGDELRYRYRYIKSIMDDLRTRFRKEYLGMMVSRNPRKATRPLEVGEMVYVGSDNRKRVSWPLGRIIKLYEGKDGFPRVADVKTAEGTLTRDVKRLYALEADASDPVRVAGELVTRSGRKYSRKTV